MNMAVLTLMSVGGTIPFLGTPHIDWKRAPLDIGLTLVGSTAGALIVFAVPTGALRLAIPISMLAVLATLFLKPHPSPGGMHAFAGHFILFLLAIYGGFFSGGYVTLLMASGMYFFHYSFLRSMAMARLLNVASSLVAAVVFASRGAIDWRIAAALCPSAFLGALLGTRIASRVDEKKLRRFFIAAVILLALQLLLKR